MELPMNFALKAMTISLVSTLSIASSAIALVAKTTTKVDCSKADKGEVTIKVVGDRLTMEKGAELAYKCLSVKNKDLAAKRKAAIAKSKVDSEPGQCGQSEPIQTLLLSSWMGERPYPSSQPDGSMIYSLGGEAKVLAREPISCAGVGSGMFGGVNQSTSVTLDITENATFDMEDESKPMNQEIKVKINKLINL
jgi:hypothetical protein